MLINHNSYFNSKLKWDKNYNINVVKDKKDLDIMIKYFEKFIKANSNLNKHISLDFEFNSSNEGKKIALFQINLEMDNIDGMIFLFYPPDLNEYDNKVLKSLLTDPNIKKILHGAESLDIPYLFKNIMTTNKLRKDFCNNLYDTRYICEYYHLDNKLDNRKCKIYHILKEMEVIDNNQFEMLLKNEEDMGPIYLVDIDVRNLNNNTMLYSAFDVLYLGALLKQFPNNSIYMRTLNFPQSASSFARIITAVPTSAGIMGEIRFNITDDKLYIWNGAIWSIIETTAS